MKKVITKFRSYNTRHSNSFVSLRLFGFFSCAIFTTLISLSDTSAQSQGNRKLEISPQSRAQIRQAISAVGLILIRNANDSESQPLKPRGSGVVVRSDGLVVTNYHVVYDSRSGRLYEDIFFSLAEDGTATDAQRYRLKAVLLNEDMDLALLKIESETDDSTVFPAVEIGDSRSIQVLDDLWIIGFPEKGGSTVTVNHGDVEGKDHLHHWIKTDARVMHGNSGGAAVTSDGKLIGIPTKVLADTQPVDTNGDGYPDSNKVYGKVAFLRPSHLITEMISKLTLRPASPSGSAASSPMMIVSPPTITVRGIVRSSAGGKSVAGARVGLIQVGTQSVTPQNLLTWGGTNSEGEFTLNKAVPPGKYTLRARALGYEAYSLDIEVDQNTTPLVIELKPAEKK
jgi:S1-C subfamily serine protease